MTPAKPEVHVIWAYHSSGVAEPIIVMGQAIPGNRDTLARLVHYMRFGPYERPEFFFLAPLPDENDNVAPVSHMEVFGHV